MKIIESYQMTITKQIKFPRSKKKRIRLKWSKNQKYLRTSPDPNCLVMNDVIFCHPSVAKALRALQSKKFEHQNYTSTGIFNNFNITPNSYLGQMFV